MKLSLMLILITILSLGLGSCDFSKEKELERKRYVKEFWRQCDVEFCGIVIEKKEIHRGAGLACIRLNNGIFNKKELYFNNKLFVYKTDEENLVMMSEVAQLKIGDSVCFNINENHTINRYRDGELIFSVENPVPYITDKSYLFRPNHINCFD